MASLKADYTIGKTEGVLDLDSAGGLKNFHIMMEMDGPMETETDFQP